MSAEDILNEGSINPQQLSDEEEALFAEIMLGEEAIRLMNSDLGRVLRGYAEQRVESAKEKLLEVDRYDTAEIEKLQFEAAVGNQFLEFIREALANSEIAHQSLIQKRGY